MADAAKALERETGRTVTARRCDITNRAQVSLGAHRENLTAIGYAGDTDTPSEPPPPTESDAGADTP